MSERVELRTERVLMRPFHITDAEDVFAYAKDPDWALYLGRRMPRPYRRRDAEEYVAGRILALWSTNPTFAIVLESTVIGAIGLNIRECPDVAGLGYAIARVHWERGFMTEAAQAVVSSSHLVAPTTKHVMVRTIPLIP